MVIMLGFHVRQLIDDSRMKKGKKTVNKLESETN